MPNSTLDEVDRRILYELQRNGKISASELAERTGTSTSPCWRRVRHLEEAGVIQRYVAVVDPLKIGLPVTIFVHVTLEKQSQEALVQFEEAIRRCQEVMECYLMTGDADYLLRVMVPDLAIYESFLMQNLVVVPGVANIRSSFALRRIQYRTEVPLDHLR